MNLLNSQKQKCEKHLNSGVLSWFVLAADSAQISAVVLDNTADTRVAELVVQSVMGLDSSTYTLEMIPELGATVVTFSSASGGWRRSPAGGWRRSPAGDRKPSDAD